MKFNLANYETVAERLHRARHDHPEMIIISKPVESLITGEPGRMMWVFETIIYKTPEDLEKGLPWANGYASGIDGGPGADQNCAQENAETSSIGRALAKCGYHGDKGLASREEMHKAQGAPVGRKPAAKKSGAGKYDPAQVSEEFKGAVEQCDSLDGLRAMWHAASNEHEQRYVESVFAAMGGGEK